MDAVSVEGNRNLYRFQKTNECNFCALKEQPM